MKLQQNPPMTVTGAIQGRVPGDWNFQALRELPGAKKRGAKFLLQTINDQGDVRSHTEWATEGGLTKALAGLRSMWRVIDVETGMLVGWQTMLAKPINLGTGLRSR